MMTQDDMMRAQRLAADAIGIDKPYRDDSACS